MSETPRRGDGRPNSKPSAVDVPRRLSEYIDDGDWSDVGDDDAQHALTRGQTDDHHSEGRSAFLDAVWADTANRGEAREGGGQVDQPPAQQATPADGPSVPAVVVRQESEAPVRARTSAPADAAVHRYDDHRPPSPATLQAFGRLGAANAAAFSPATLTSYEEYLANSSGQPVYGIPVACVPPQHAQQYPGGGQHQHLQTGSPHGAQYPYHPQPSSGQQVVVVQDAAQLQPLPLAEMNLEAADPNLEDIWRRRRNVLIYATADTFVVCVLIWSWVLVVVLLPFPILGLFATWKYRPALLRVYLSYFPVIVAVRGYVGYVQIEDEDPMRMQYPLIALCAIGAIAEIYIGYSVYHFRKALASVSEEALSLLRQGWRPGMEVGGQPLPQGHGFW